MDFSVIEGIFNNTLQTMETAKEDIFDITEKTRAEFQRLEQELFSLKTEISTVIIEVDKQTKLAQITKQKLIEANKKFNETLMSRAYKEATDTQAELLILQSKEAQLRQRRDEIERALRQMELMIKKAESLIVQISGALTLLQGGLIQEQKDNFVFKIIQSQEEERSRVAREIHDGPAQALTSMVIQLEITEKLLNLDLEKARDEIDKLKNRVRANLQEMRRIIFNLRPIELNDSGIVSTLSKYFVNYKNTYKIECLQKITGTIEQRLNTYLEIALFRIIQESMTNIAKHAQASLVTMTLDFDQNEIKLEINDNGCGFDSEKIWNKLEGHFGLIGIKERVEMFSGKFLLKSQPGIGTNIKIVIPIKNAIPTKTTVPKTGQISAK